MRRNGKPIITGKHQRGAATLLVSLVVLTTITFITLYTARTVMTEQQISGNELRGRMAFEAAEAGSEMAIAYIRGGRDRDGDNLLPGELPGSDDDEFIFDLTGSDGIGDTNTLVLANGSSVTVSLQAADFVDVGTGLEIIATRITSQGWSDDRTATRTIVQEVANVSPLPNGPQNPLISRGAVVVNGASVVQNPEGNSTIWSGGDVDLSSNNNTNTQIADPGDPNYPDCLGDSANPCGMIQGSDRYVPGVDIIEYDSSLANLSPDEFFANFFGSPPARYREDYVTIDIDTGAGDSVAPIHLADSEVIWVQGDLTLGAGTTMGCLVAVTGSNRCPANQVVPSILIVQGDLNLSGNAQFYGLVYVTGNIEGSGSPVFVGSLVTASTSTTTGSLNITYNSSILRQISRDPGKTAGGGGGSWRDF